MSDDPRHRELIDGYCSGTLSDSEFQELEEVLCQLPELRRELLESRMLDSDLRDHAVGQAGLSLYSESDSDSQERRTVRRLRHEVWAMAAVIALLLGGMAVLLLSPDEEPRERIDRGVAVLTRTIDAKWSGSDWREGDSVPPGIVRLESGTVELEFYSGASVILEAPAELEIVSEDGGSLLVGKLRAQVPLHAQGFTITTPEVELVDLGTSFGMQVSSETGTAIHVFDGEVELFEPGQSGRRENGESLLAGEGRQIANDGEVAVIAANDSEFVGPTEFDRRARARLEQGLQQWQANLPTLREREDLVALYDFQPADPASRVLEDRSGTSGAEQDGSIIGAGWESGRWPGKSSLEFKRPSDRVRVRVPGEFESLTLITWVRVDGFDNQFSSLLLSDGWGRPGALHWQIHREGYIELAVYYGNRKETYNSRAPFTMRPSDFGRWMQLAVVYDGATGVVTHFRDGILIGRVEVDAIVPLAIGDAEIGNWTPGGELQARKIRHFNGRVDEFLILDRALIEEEVKEFYRWGQP